MPVSRVFLYISFRIPSKVPPLQVPLVELPQTEIYAPFPELFICLSESLVKEPPSRFPSGACLERYACLQSLVHISWSPNKQGLLIKHNLTFFSKSVKEAPPPWSPSSSPMERDAEFPESTVYSFICISEESPFDELSLVTEEKYIWSPALEAHTDRRPVYCGVQLGSQKGLFVTLVSLPQCHAALNTIPSTLAWVDC
jgi:hypothetical protein